MHNDIRPMIKRAGACGTLIDCRKGVGAKLSRQEHLEPLICPSSQVQPTMATTSTLTCGPITELITDAATNTYSNLDTGFTPPKSCLQPTYASLPADLDPVFALINTFTVRGNPAASMRWMKVYRGRGPACFPSHYPKTCEWHGRV
jgi:hypothetical protein